MSTYLLTWNRRKSQIDNFAQKISAVKRGKQATETWSCGNTKSLRMDDRVFFIKQGEEPRGIFASGKIVKGTYQDSHWDQDRAQKGETAHLVEVEFDVLLDPDNDQILPRALLQRMRSLSGMHWDTPKSGIEIQPRIAQALEREWQKLLQGTTPLIPEEVIDSVALVEGAVETISVNRYERNKNARRKCIEHYGTKCVICGFDFGEVYGYAGQGIIHVHHLRQLSEVRKSYRVDPIRDLRPVCPNCHAVIHNRVPAYSIDDMFKILNRSKS